MTDRDLPPPPRSEPTLVGQVLAERYRLTRKIGEGGMGAVYEAEHLLIGKPVAIKVLRDKYLDRPEVARRLVQEARLASSIRHEHIIDITDSGTTADGRTFVVMEHLVGQSLAERLRQEGTLPEAQVIEIGLQAASALKAAHARGIIHRDVKPENLFLVERQGHDFVKVLDFGISKDLSEESAAESLQLTRTGMLLGTPLYMSPEQAAGADDVDQRADIYALGVILYECLTGEVPFRASNYLQVIAQVVNQPVVPPRTLRPELPISESMERVVAKAMAKERLVRLPTMEALIEDLERVRAGDQVVAPLLSKERRRRTPASSGLWLAAVAVFAGTALLLALDRLAHPPARPAAAAATATAATGVAVTPPGPATTAPLVHITIETSPSGAEIRHGAQLLGVAPQSLALPRSSQPTLFTFHLPGYEEQSATVVPNADDRLVVKLAPRPRGRHPRANAASEPAPIGGETLPNPY